MLWQLPESLRFDADVIDGFFGRLPRTTGEAAKLARGHDDKVKEGRSLTSAEEDVPMRHALEFRSQTFVAQEAYDVLRRHDVACVLADTAGRWPKVEEVTSDFMYLRLHGDKELYASGYSEDRSPTGPRSAARGSGTVSTCSSTSTTTSRAMHPTTR